MRTWTWVRCLCPALALSAGVSTGASAQRARLLVLVRDSQSTTALSGVELRLDHRPLGDTTDAEGIARVQGVSPGLHLLGLYHIGYVPDSLSVTVIDTGSTTVEVVLAPAATTLPGVTTSAQRQHVWLRGFYQRRKTEGGGFFFDRQQIDSSRTRNLGELLQEGANARIVPGPAGKMYLMSHSAQIRGLQGESLCPVQIYLDGTIIFSPLYVGSQIPDLRDFLSDQFEAVEYYPNPSSTPEQFRTSAASCGTLVLWSRMH